MTMSSQDGGWLQHGQKLPPATPEARKQYPEHAVDGPQLGPRLLVSQARELVTQRNVLGDEIRSVLEDGDDNGENQWELEGHLANDSRLTLGGAPRGVPLCRVRKWMPRVLKRHVFADADR